MHTVSEAAMLSGLAPGQVSGLLHRKIILPEIHESYGTGDSSILGEKNVRELMLVRRLREAGVTPKLTFSILKMLVESVVNKDWWKEEGNYVVMYGDGWFVTNNVFSVGNVATLREKESVLLVRL